LNGRFLNYSSEVEIFISNIFILAEELTMKTLSCFFVLGLLSFTTLAQDAVKPDPLLGNYIFANSAELVNISLTNSPHPVIRHDIHDFFPLGQMGGPQPGFSATADSLRIDFDYNNFNMDYVAADVNGNGKDELVIARADSLNRLAISVASVKKYGAMFSWNPSSVLESTQDTVTGSVRIISANLDWTPQKELIVCFRNPEGVKVIFYDSLDVTTQKPVERTSVVFPSDNIFEFDLAAGDFDNDGLDEIMIASVADSLTLQVIDYNPASKSLQLWPKYSLPPGSVFPQSWLMKITAGDFRNRKFDEAVLSFTQSQNYKYRQIYLYVSIDPGGQVLSTTQTISYPSGYTWEQEDETNAVASDLNPIKSDGDELVVAGAGELAVLKFDLNGNPRYLTKKSIPYDINNVYWINRRKFLAVADVDADTSASTWIPEIVLAQYNINDSTTLFRVNKVDIDSTNQIIGMTEVFAGSYGLKSTYSEIVMGDFDGDAIKVGTPKLITKNSVYQPIVILNVPPTHFDYLNGQVYDVCNLHTSTPSEFSVTYTETNSSSSHFSSESNTTWGLSGSISGGFSAFGTKVKAYVKGSYDKGYYGSKSLSTTVTASQVTQSSGDDWILATVTDYDFWEYPVYAMGSQVGNNLIMIPHFKGTEWFPSRNIIARNWLADHEVGNLFSYAPKDDISEWIGDGSLLTSFTGKYISTASSGSWDLDMETQSIDQNKLTSKIGVEVGGSVKKWGVEVDVSGNYSSEEITTATSTATKSVKIDVKVSDTDKTLGDTDYKVTPYIYWGENGALIVDYAVDPSSSGDPVYGTFWDKNYLSYSDPGFILPWRLDSLKGIGGTANMKLYCKSIHISPQVPSAGDTLHILARVHNFSLKNTDGIVTVQFYLGNPASGGTPIVGIDGSSEVSTISSIKARNFATVEMDWIVPSGLSSNSTIYAVIDPHNTITELHEDNNIGFVPLNAQAITGLEEESVPALPVKYVLQQNYPNPFNNSTVIIYSIPKEELVTIKIYNILGEEVAALVNETKAAGNYKVTFNSDNLTSGVYLYKLTSGGFTQTKKMILLK
jgi:hypothetical protein